jgi:hypothetical protein
MRMNLKRSRRHTRDLAMDLAMTKDLFSADEKNPQVMVIGFHPPFHGNVMGMSWDKKSTYHTWLV